MALYHFYGQKSAFPLSSSGCKGFEETIKGAPPLPHPPHHTCIVNQQIEEILSYLITHKGTDNVNGAESSVTVASCLSRSGPGGQLSQRWNGTGKQLEERDSSNNGETSHPVTTSHPPLDLSGRICFLEVPAAGPRTPRQELVLRQPAQTQAWPFISLHFYNCKHSKDVRCILDSLRSQT
ncbi:hypothetical protein OJAV_G00200010 [Oryzias javanicus]|uniref:Uncharacterized protein n=1 Tax=Oryzias javanicus TaxID=123683 RepID=A0A437C972_ORYJA|nr:hypothetical protein OJAV_G00200010 [Oryzias javanicus]